MWQGDVRPSWWRLPSSEEAGPPRRARGSVRCSRSARTTHHGRGGFHGDTLASRLQAKNSPPAISKGWGGGHRIWAVVRVAGFRSTEIERGRDPEGREARRRTQRTIGFLSQIAHVADRPPGPRIAPPMGSILNRTACPARGSVSPAGTITRGVDPEALASFRRTVRPSRHLGGVRSDLRLENERQAGRRTPKPHEDDRDVACGRSAILRDVFRPVAAGRESLPGFPGSGTGPDERQRTARALDFDFDGLDAAQGFRPVR